MNTDITEMLRTPLELSFFLFLLIFTVQAIFFGYHWFKFGSSKRISMVALSIYLLGGAVLFLTLSIALNQM